jgi:hypothetical protein
MKEKLVENFNNKKKLKEFFQGFQENVTWDNVHSAGMNRIWKLKAKLVAIVSRTRGSMEMVTMAVEKLRSKIEIVEESLS